MECVCEHPHHLGLCEVTIERDHVEDICGCLTSAFKAPELRELRQRDAAQQRQSNELKSQQRKPRKPYAKYTRFKIK